MNDTRLRVLIVGFGAGAAQSVRRSLLKTLLVGDLTAAGYGKDVISEALEQQYRMLDKLGHPYTRIKC